MGGRSAARGGTSVGPKLRNQHDPVKALACSGSRCEAGHWIAVTRNDLTKRFPADLQGVALFETIVSPRFGRPRDAEVAIGAETCRGTKCTQIVNRRCLRGILRGI